MSYYLIHQDHSGFADKIHIVGSCKLHQQKEIILNNYCKNNSINLVPDRKTINEKCRGKELYTYKVSDNRYIVLDCTEHKSGYFQSGYVEKYTKEWLEFIFFAESEFPLGEIKNSLKMKVKKKLNTVT